MTDLLYERLASVVEGVPVPFLDLTALKQRVRARRARRISLVLAFSLVSIAGVTALAVTGRKQEIRVATGIQGVERFDDLAQHHVVRSVEYEQSPPVGGDHSDRPQTCDFYPSAVPNKTAVHSLEHGAVWITYGPELPADQVQALRIIQARRPAHTLVSLYPALGSGISVQAWGVRLFLNSAQDPRLDEFIREFIRRGPEPGAACVGTAEMVTNSDDLPAADAKRLRDGGRDNL